jgi:hypothetical protein
MTLRNRLYPSHSSHLGLTGLLLVQLAASPLDGQAPVQSALVINVRGIGLKHTIGHPKPVEIGAVVTDENSRPVEGAIVTFQLPDKGPGGTFTDNQLTKRVPTNPSGEALVTDFRPNDSPGDFQIRVTALYKDPQGNVKEGGPNQIVQANVLAIRELKIAVLQGNKARNDVRTGVGVQPRVQVRDSEGLLVQDAKVTFTVLEPGPGGIFRNGKGVLEIRTDRKGEAAGEGFRPVRPCGKLNIKVAAQLAHLTAGGTIEQANEGCGGFPKWVIAVIAAGGAGGAIVATQGKGKTAASGTSTQAPPISIQPGAPVFGPPR